MEPSASTSGPPPAAPPGTGRPEVEEARFRLVLGHFATGVTVVTGTTAEGPVGLAVNSFTSISLSPPLVGFCARNDSRSWPRMRAAGSFCVNVLGEDQEELSRAFAQLDADRFLGVGWRPAPSGAPRLEGILAWVDCDLEAEHAAGDHVIVVGRVRDLGVSGHGGPLVFYRGGYGRLTP